MTNFPPDPIDIARKKIRIWTCALFLEWVRAIFLLLGFIIVLIITIALVARIGHSTVTSTSTPSTPSTLSTLSTTSTPSQCASITTAPEASASTTTVATAAEASARLERAGYTGRDEVIVSDRRIIKCSREIENASMVAIIMTWPNDDNIVVLSITCFHQQSGLSDEDKQAIYTVLIDDATKLFPLRDKMRLAASHLQPTTNPEGLIGVATTPGWEIECRFQNHESLNSHSVAFMFTSATEYFETRLKEEQDKYAALEKQRVESTTPSPPTGSTHTSPSKDKSPMPDNWDLVGEWHGSSTTKTEMFTISEAPWGIDWQCKAGTISISIEGDQSEYFGGAVARNPMVGYCYEPGTFYLSIDASTPYTVRVWQASSNDLADEVTSTPRSGPDSSRNWRLVAEYEGSSVRPTEPFTITRAPWAVDWQCDKRISITINGAGDNAGADATYLGGQPAPELQVEYLRTIGDFYLNINCRDPYLVRVWESQ